MTLGPKETAEKLLEVMDKNDGFRKMIEDIWSNLDQGIELTPKMAKALKSTATRVFKLPKEKQVETKKVCEDFSKQIAQDVVDIVQENKPTITTTVNGNEIQINITLTIKIEGGN